MHKFIPPDSSLSRQREKQLSDIYSKKLSCKKKVQPYAKRPGEKGLKYRWRPRIGCDSKFSAISYSEAGMRQHKLT